MPGGDSDNIYGLVVPAYPGREWNFVLKSRVKGLHREVPDQLQWWLAASLGTCSSSWPPLWLTSATSPTTISSVNINSACWQNKQTNNIAIVSMRDNFVHDWYIYSKSVFFFRPDQTSVQWEPHGWILPLHEQLQSHWWIIYKWVLVFNGPNSSFFLPFCLRSWFC